MIEKKPEKGRSKFLVMGLAMGIPSTIIGLFLFFYFLDGEKILDLKYGITILVFYVFYTLYLMIKYAKQKN